MVGSSGSRAVQAVVFDMDGVLVDSEPIWRKVEQRVFATVGVELDDDRCRETMGLRVNEVVAHWYERHPWGDLAPQQVEAAIVAGVVDAVRSRGAALPGVEHALSLCRAHGARTAVASSSYLEVIRAVLERLDLASQFEVVVSAQDVPRGKPDPAVYLLAARELCLAPGDCLAIEDSEHGVRAARAAGLRCIGIPEPGADPEALRRAGAAPVLDSLAELRAHHLGAPSEHAVTVRPATSDDFARLQEIEVAAGRAFAEVGLPAIADDAPFSIAELEAFRRPGRLWVLDAETTVVGYVAVDVLDGSAHIEQVSIHPDSARRGLGRLLIDHVVDWTAARGMGAVTLTTFRDVPWNGPLYERYGFRVMSADEVGPDLRTRCDEEADDGLDPALRICMVCAVP